MMNDIQELYQQLILDHGRHPRNFACMENATATKEGFNPLCGDKLTLYLQLSDGIIEKASFEGCGCAISVASASLMTEKLQGLSVVEVQSLFDCFHSVLTEDNNSAELAATQNKLGKLMALAGVKAFPMRVKCATLAWHTLLAAVNEQK